TGAKKIAQIRDNSNFFRSELQKMGFEVLGDNDSPVMPFMVYNPAKMPAFSRECLKQNVSFFQVHHKSIKNLIKQSCPFSKSLMQICLKIVQSFVLFELHPVTLFCVIKKKFCSFN
ncbi:Os01g0928600, partial [Oryza sativa Japonica Group]